jgi:hypothetical protein
MGALHPFEQALTLLLAFGPFVVLGVVIWRRRREEDAAETPDPSDHAAVSETGSAGSEHASPTAGRPEGDVRPGSGE